MAKKRQKVPQLVLLLIGFVVLTVCSIALLSRCLFQINGRIVEALPAAEYCTYGARVDGRKPGFLGCRDLFGSQAKPGELVVKRKWDLEYTVHGQSFGWQPQTTLYSLGLVFGAIVFGYSLRAWRRQRSKSQRT